MGNKVPTRYKEDSDAREARKELLRTRYKGDQEPYNSEEYNTAGKKKTASNGEEDGAPGPAPELRKAEELESHQLGSQDPCAQVHKHQKRQRTQRGVSTCTKVLEDRRTQNTQGTNGPQSSKAAGLGKKNPRRHNTLERSKVPQEVQTRQFLKTQRQESGER